MIYKLLKKYDIKFGIEIELTGLNKEEVCNIIQKVVGGKIVTENDRWFVEDKVKRKWRVVFDRSIESEVDKGNLLTFINDKLDKLQFKNLDNKNINTVCDLFKELSITYLKQVQIEVVSPVCTIADLCVIEEITKSITENNGKVNSSCGIHIHVSSPHLTPGKLQKLTILTKHLESMLFGIFSVDKERRKKYCKKMSTKFFEEISQTDFRYSRNMNKLLDIWYKHCSDSDESRTSKYNSSRYHGFNLHAFNLRGAVEFRYFNSSLTKNKIEAYIMFCLGLVVASIHFRGDLPEFITKGDFLDHILDSELIMDFLCIPGDIRYYYDSSISTIKECVTSYEWA